ncbi:MAG: OmpA family protein [Cognatishimia sp.]|nr:OmpA family protein [Cognatishimia sp.]
MTLKAALVPLILLPLPLAALEIAMPEGSAVQFESFEETASYGLPDAPYQDGYLSTRRVNGEVTKQVWGLTGSASTEQLIEPLRRQIEAGGYAIMLDCDSDSCGGYDFRFNTDVVPAPDMFVDLQDFRFVSALKESFTGSEAISVLVSRTADLGLMQIISVVPSEAEAELPLSSGISLGTISATPVIARGSTILALRTGGRAVLSDLSFQTGSSQLADLPFQSLRDLASFLAEDPARRIALVGHSDNVGSLDNNMKLSEKRAMSVAAYLIDRLGVSADQIDSYGVGFLSPLATNSSEAGKTSNRRVEAVLLNP